ncbi:MAG TPA: SGNH/GDSL hydrolase family protein, partial [Patescibacteria group bacterium]
LQKALEYYYPGRKFRILNYGVGGSTIDYALFRLSSSYQYLGKNIPPLLSTEPDIVVIESFAYNNFGNTQAGIDKQWLNLGAITTVIKNKLPRTKIVMAAAIAPNSITYANGVKDLHLTALDKIERVSTIDLYLQNLVNFATSQSYPLADAYHPSLTDGKNGRKDLINTTDYIHPSELGNQFFCDIVAKSVFDNKLL